MPRTPPPERAELQTPQEEGGENSQTEAKTKRQQIVATLNKHALSDGKSGKKSGKNKMSMGPYAQNAIRKFRLHQTVQATSDVSGQLALNYSVRNPSGAQDYSSIADLFDEYRVVGYQIQFFTYYPNGSSSTINYDGLMIAFDSDDSATTAPTSFAGVLGYENLKAYPLYKDWKHKIKSIPHYISTTATGAASPGWNRVGFECDNGRLLCYTSSLDSSTAYGRFLITFDVEFRTRT